MIWETRCAGNIIAGRHALGLEAFVWGSNMTRPGHLRPTRSCGVFLPILARWIISATASSPCLYRTMPSFPVSETSIATASFPSLPFITTERGRSKTYSNLLIQYNYNLVGRSRGTMFRRRELRRHPHLFFVPALRFPLTCWLLLLVYHLFVFLLKQ